MNLSNAQKTAVEYTDGPQIILAGAGSGKTGVVVAKAHYLIEQKRFAPESLLVITYSNKTQAELEDRMSSLGSSMPEIKTFHSFGMELISEFSHLLNLPGVIVKINDYRLWQYLKRAIGELRQSDLLDTNQPGRVYRDITTFISRAKDELVTPEEIISKAEEQLSRLSSANDLDADDLALTEDRWTKVLEAGRIYQSYEKIKAEEGRRTQTGGIDYGDMIVLSHRLLVGEKIVGATLRKRLRYILVDEFQDANYAQVEILRLLVGDRCGIAVVGDDDQAIYRFRGASFGSFRLFQKLFPGFRVFRLEDNYRSSANIVGAAQALIEVNPGARFDPAKKMSAVGEPGRKIVVRKCPDDYSEAESVANEIERLLQNEEYKSPASIAVLFRARRHKDVLVSALQRKGIEFDYDRKIAEASSKPGQILNALYQFSVDNQRLNLLPSIINHFVPSLSPELEREINYRLSSEAGKSIDVLKMIAFEFDDTLAGALNGVIDLLEHFGLMITKKEPLPLLESIISEAGILRSVIVEGKVVDQQAAAEIAQMLRTVDRFQAENENPTHAAFLDYLAWHSTSDENDSAEAKPESPVVLQTVHGSKGLEYPIVFMIGLSNRRFPPQKQYALLEFPPELYKDELPLGDYRIQEERRLFYVGMTRAKQMLYLYGVEKKGTKISQFVSDLRKSPLFDRVGLVEPVESSESTFEEQIGPLEASSDPSSAVILSASEPIEKALEVALLELWRRKGAAAETQAAYEKLRQEFLARIASEFDNIKAKIEADPFRPPEAQWKYQVDSLSYTDIEAFDTCPLKFYFRKVLRIPPPSGPQQTLGSVIHSVLETAGRGLMENQPKAFDDLAADFENRWRGVHFDDPDRKERLRVRGREALERFVKMQSQRTGQPVALEKLFKVDLAKARLTGRIDRIDKTPAGYEVVDYKTGKQTSVDLKSNLQLPIYSLACYELLGEYPANVIYMFLGDDTVHAAHYDIEALETVKSTILDQVDKINTSDFVATPGHHCGTCDFRDICPAKQE